MGPDASTGPPGLRVERHAEANRLAQEFQAQAYEALVPRRRGRTTTAAPAPAAGAGTVHHPNAPKGVAA